MEKKHKLLTFYVKCLVISLPVLLLVAFYAYKDPFMVLRSYTDYDHSLKDSRDRRLKTCCWSSNAVSLRKKVPRAASCILCLRR